MIDLKEILINSNYKKETEELINIANWATCERISIPVWSIGSVMRTFVI